MTESQQQTPQPQRSSTRTWLIGSIVVATIFGFAAGFVAELFSRYYLLNVSLFQDLYLQNIQGTQSRDVVIRDPRKVVVEQDVRIDQVKSELQGTTVLLAKKKPAAASPLDEVYLDSDILGHGLVITSDGWIATSANIPISLKNTAVITSQKKIYSIDSVTTDAASGYQFIKISAQNLPVLKFADAKGLATTTTVAAYNVFGNELMLSAVVGGAAPLTSKYETVVSSEYFGEGILLADALPAAYEGAPVVSLGGEVLGIYVAGAMPRVRPVTHMTSAIDAVLKQEPIVRPYLGVYFVDIAGYYGLSADRLQGRTAGALITQGRTGVAVSVSSPVNGILKPGDIITRVEGKDLTRSYTLPDAIREYKSGDEITLTYVRESETKDVTVILGEQR